MKRKKKIVLDPWGSWKATSHYRSSLHMSTKFKGTMTMRTSEIPVALRERMLAAVKRGFHTAPTGAVVSGLDFLCQALGYADGFPHVARQCSITLPKQLRNRADWLQRIAAFFVLLEVPVYEWSSGEGLATQRNLYDYKKGSGKDTTLRSKTRKFVKAVCRDPEWLSLRQPLIDALSLKTDLVIEQPFDSDVRNYQ